jgi:uncharacterized protein (DUF736 family)
METKLNSGAIFKNTKTKDTQPDYRGKVNVNGKDMEVSLWVKESKTGTKYFSASFQEPYVKPVSQETINQNNAQDLADNDLPW